jgi:preprotein translocase subunit SecD
MAMHKIAIILAALATALVTGTGLNHGRAETPKPDLSKTGGTVLIYEVEIVEPPPEGPRIESLAQALKKRIDPADLTAVSVRRVGKTRVEIVLPWMGKDHEQSVRRIKDLVARTGQLEFRIVANEHDDAKALEAARKYFAEVSGDPKRMKQIEEAALKGRPPAPPTPPDGKAFETPLGKSTYAWVELGRAARRSLNLDNDAELDPERKEAWANAADARRKGETLWLGRLGGALLYSRTCQDRHLGERERSSKKFEYFILCRDPEKAKEITGAYLDRVEATKGGGGRPAVSFRFNAKGGELLYELTSRNASARRPDQPGCHLAIILDGQIMAAPRVQGAVGRDGQINGSFTQAEVDRMVNILRSGALPVPLKPVPVREETVEPNRAGGTRKNPAP